MANPETARGVLNTAAVSSDQPRALPFITVNDMLWLLYLYPIRWVAAVLPRRAMYAIGRMADPFVQHNARREKAKAGPWISKVCGVSAEVGTRIANQVVRNKIFQLIDELLLLRRSFGREIRCAEVEGLHHLEAAVARGRGVILLVGHFRANQIAVRYLATMGRRALDLNNQQPPNKLEGRLGRRFLNPRFVQLQKLAYPDQVYIQDPECSLKIMRRLRTGGLVVIPVDGHGDTRTIEHSFLGKPWRVPAGVFEIVRLSSCGVVPMLCLGRSDSLRIRFSAMLEVGNASSREAFVCTNLQRFLAYIEEQVIANPEEWTLWNHRA